MKSPGNPARASSLQPKQDLKSPGNPTGPSSLLPKQGLKLHIGASNGQDKSVNKLLVTTNLNSITHSPVSNDGSSSQSNLPAKKRSHPDSSCDQISKQRKLNTEEQIYSFVRDKLSKYNSTIPNDTIKCKILIDIYKEFNVANWQQLKLGFFTSWYSKYKSNIVNK